MKGNGLIQAGTFFAILLGYIAGANLILSPAGITIISAAIIAIAVIGFIASLSAPPAPPSPGAEKGRIDFFLIPAIAQSIRLAYGVPVAFRAIICISWFWFAGATYLTLLPVFTTVQLGADETVFTLLLAAFSIGVAIGAALCAKLYKDDIRVGYAPWGALGIAVFSIDLSFAAGAQMGIDPSTLDLGALSGYWRGVSDFVLDAALLDIGGFLASDNGWRVLIDFVLLAICAGLYVTPPQHRLSKRHPAGDPWACGGELGYDRLDHDGGLRHAHHRARHDGFGLAGNFRHCRRDRCDPGRVRGALGAGDAAGAHRPDVLAE